MPKQQVLFDTRFLNSYVGGRLLGDARIALIELLANSWDAGATHADIDWSESQKAGIIRIIDNGHGMTDTQFRQRWLTLAYDRVREQGTYAEFPPEVNLPKRPVFGQNGQGRFAAFCFGDEYLVNTWRDGEEVSFKVNKGVSISLEIEKISSKPRSGSGTEIKIRCPFIPLSSEHIRAEIGMRFLTDPNFKVFVSGVQVQFSDIPQNYLSTEQIEIDSLGHVYVTVIDMQDTDRTMKQHGIAWHVNKRLVGECSWRSFSDQAFIDGRRIAAKRYTFIVRADFLNNSIKSDWSGFKAGDEIFFKTNHTVSDWIRQYIINTTSEKRNETFKNVMTTHKNTLRKMGPLALNKWGEFIQSIQKECISISERDLLQLAGILAKLEIAHSKYGLLDKLHGMEKFQLDDLFQLLNDWTIDMAKIIFDELKSRMILLDELQKKVIDKFADEVQELQPIFERGLWIFGPEFETIEFTSNQGMTRVIHDIFGVAVKGSRHRLDFVILPNSTVGFYSYPSYDEDGSEIGVDHLVIIELKRAGVLISTDEKAQCWKYVKEFIDKGLLNSATRVTCFVLGSKIDPSENHERLEANGMVKIKPLNYSLVIERAKSRLLKLFDRVKTAPFLNQADVKEYLNPPQEIIHEQMTLIEEGILIPE